MLITLDKNIDIRHSTATFIYSEIQNYAKKHLYTIAKNNQPYHSRALLLQLLSQTAVYDIL